MINRVSLAAPVYAPNKIGFKAVNSNIQKLIGFTKTPQPDASEAMDLMPELNNLKPTNEDLDAVEKALANKKDWKTEAGYRGAIEDLMTILLTENGRQVKK